jgi:3'-5' exoribonuclease
MGRLAARHYNFIDGDLLLTGAILHDIGKIYELNYERGFSYSSDGQLLGHIHIGLRIVGEKLRGLPQFPPALRSLVEHMILSHHGKLEFGSPKVPQFPEAMLLHYLDDMDSKMECMRALIASDRQVEGCFTAYNQALERSVLKKDLFLNPPDASAVPAAASVSSPASVPAVESVAAMNTATKEAAAPAPATAATAVHNGTPKSDSPFADKLKQALQPARTSEGN